MILLNEIKSLNILAGSNKIKILPDRPFSNINLDFLKDLSSLIRKSKDSKLYSDLMTFSFWCRESNLKRYRDNYSFIKNRLGRGLVFHIAPSNVPLNFAYSFIFGLLSGNANIIKVPSKSFLQVDLLLLMINQILKKEKYNKLYLKNSFLNYNKDSSATELLSSVCDIRLIWGGDTTINKIRESTLQPKSIDFTFSDRYSIALINSDELINASEKEISSLSEAFYNDTYLMDQNACSSPHIVFWVGNSKIKAKKLFWDKLNLLVEKKYLIDDMISIEKHLQLCEDAINLKSDFKFSKYANRIYLLTLRKLPDNLEELRGKCGYFYQYDINEESEISLHINKKFQTLTYYGLNKEKLMDTIIKNNLTGIDRIVPIGRALDIDLVWDGYDMITSLSRQITF